MIEQSATKSTAPQRPQIVDVYEEWDYIDAKDNMGDWRVGIIVEKNDRIKQMKVRFDGWPSKYDEFYKFGSPKLEHFRFITLGYTGQKINPAIRSHWKFSLQEHIIKLDALKEFMKKGRFEMKGYQLTQYLRGKHYIYIDCLLQTTFSELVELKSTIEYLKVHIDITFEFITLLDTSFKNVNQDITISTQAAFDNSYYQLFDGCASILGAYKRINVFYKNNQKLLSEMKDIKSKPSATLSVEQFGDFYIRIIYISYFVERGGWTVLENLFQKLLEAKNIIIPFPFLESLITFFTQLNKFSLPNKVKKHTDMLVQIIKRNMQKVNEKTIKDYERTTISNASDKIITMLNRNSDIQKSSASIAKTVSAHQQMEDTIKELEMLDLNISYQYFKCPYFEKKLKGITCLKDSLNKIDSKRITAKQFYDWALSIGLLKEICDDNTHVEIIKRAAEILRLLCESRVLTNPTLDIIWEAREDKHEATLKALDQLLLQIVGYLNSDQIDYLFNKIIKVKIQSWDFDYLQLVKKFSEFAIRQDRKGNESYGIPAIYAFAELKQQQKSLSALFDLLNLPLMDKQLDQYRSKCIKKIKEGINSFFHIQLFLRIQKYSTSVATINRSIVEVLIKDIIRNHDKINQLGYRFQLLDCLLPNHQTEVSLKEQDLDALWMRFKKQQQEKQAGEIFLRWLCPYDEGLNYYRIKHYLTSEIKQYIFKQILCNHKKNDFFNLDITECNIFLAFFVDVNISHGKLSKAKVIGSKFKVKTLDLIGINQLWGIFLNCKNPQTIKRTAEFICDLHSKLSLDLEKSKEQIGMRLIEKAIEHIGNGIKKQNHLSVKNFLSLLLIFVNKIEGYFQLDENFKPRSSFPKQYIIVDSSNHQKIQIKFNIYLPFGLLRKKIGRLFNTDTRHFELQHKIKNLISHDYDQYPIVQCSIGQTIHFIPCQPKQNYVKKHLNKHLELFLDMLTTEYAQEVWSIVSTLPVSEAMKFKIDEVKNWEQFLQGGIYKELYLLRIIEAMKIEEWERFIENNGVKSITNKLNTKIEQQIDIEYLKSLTNILIKCICSEKKDTRLFQHNNLNIIAGQLIQLLNKLIVYSMKPKNDEDDTAKEELELGKNIFEILYKIKSYVKILVSFSSLGNLERLLENGLMKSPNIMLKQIFCTQLLRLIIFEQKDQPQQATIISITVFTLLLEKIIHQQKTKIFFQFSTKLMERLDESSLELVFKKVPNMMKRLVRFLDEDEGEMSFNEESQTFWGVTQLMNQILLRRQLKTQDFDRKFLSNYILHECLFEFKKNQIRPKCKAVSTRSSAFQLLWTLIHNDHKLVYNVIEYLSELHKTGHWRTTKWTEWVLNPKSLQKSSTGYVGLKNLGCICYMNSFLQQIFMIKSFRQEILNADDPQFDKVKEEDNLLYQLKAMFLALEQSDEQYYNPKPFTIAFKDYDGKPTNVLEQMDIDEFSGFLLDKLETQLKGSKNAANVVSNHFSGIISNEIICKGCPHYSQNKQPFVSLGLQVKNKEDIYESLESLIKGEMLEGQNAYYCERCSKKVSALKRGCIKQLPNHLIIALKRFQFNYETMGKNKINDYCKFPQELNLEKYSQNYLRKTENNDNKFGEDETLIQYPPEYYEYELKGVVIHLGFADNGHYYSYIEDREGTKEWYEFNDTIVRKFDVDNLANEAFGGEEKAMDLTLKEKNRNAYLLFYDRKVKLDTKGNKLESALAPRTQLPYLKKFITDLKQSNQKYYLFRLIFSPDYDEFIKCILNNPNLLDEQTNTELLNFVLLYYLTKTIRDYSKKLAFETGEMLIQKALNNVKFAMRVLKVLSEQSTIQQLLKFNPMKEVKKLIANFIIPIAKIVYKIEGEGANNRLFECVGESNVPVTVLGNFINSLLKSGTSGKLLQLNNQMFMILAKIAEFGPETAEYLLRKKTLFIILSSALEKEVKTKPEFETMEEENYLGKMVIDQKQAILFNIKNKTKKQEDKAYLWYLLAELIQHCDLKINGYPNYFTGTNFPLPPEQLELVYLNSNFLYNTISEVKGKLMMRKLIKYVCTICVQNHKMTEEIPQLLIKGLKNLETSKYRGLMMLCKHFIRIPDKLMISRYSSFSQEVKEGLEENIKYSVELDVISQWYIKIARKNEGFRKHIKAHNSTLKMIQHVNKQRKVPEDIAKKYRTLCDKVYQVLHGVMILKSEASYCELSKFKEKQITALLEGTELPYRADEGWDSDDDLEDKEVVKDQIVMAFYDKGILNFVEMKVVSNILNRLTLEYNGDLYQFWKDDELLTTQHKVVTFDEPRGSLLCDSDETASIGSYTDPLDM